jgi:PAS domain S-box-containing protein
MAMQMVARSRRPPRSRLLAGSLHWQFTMLRGGLDSDMPRDATSKRPRRRILIVAEELGAAKKLEKNLAELGYEVAAIASPGDEAIAARSEIKPDLVLMDVPLEAAAAGKGGSELDERFFTTSIDMLCFLDFKGYFKRLNPAWERTLGFTREELMSRPFIEFVHPDDRERTLKQNASVREGGQALHFENRYMCKDGTYRWFLWNAAPDSAEQVIYSVARDITARKQAEEEREKLVQELKTALAEVNTLRAILPICSYCRKIRDDENYWHTVENYISRHTSTQFTHGICPSCLATQMAEP